MGLSVLFSEILGNSTTQRVSVTRRGRITKLQEQTTARRSSGVSTQTLRVVLKLTQLNDTGVERHHRYHCVWNNHVRSIDRTR